MVSHTLDPRIRLETSTGRDLPPIFVDATHLHTALLNLAINARDAMPSGGELRIEAMSGNAVGADGPGGADANLAVIRVTDTGNGMAPDILARACEPFFSTKGLNGTGLGLSMVHGFASSPAVICGSSAKQAEAPAWSFGCHSRRRGSTLLCVPRCDGATAR